MSSIYPSIIYNTASGCVTHPKRIPQSYKYTYHVIFGLPILHVGNFLDTISFGLVERSKQLDVQTEKQLDKFSQKSPLTMNIYSSQMGDRKAVLISVLTLESKQATECKSCETIKTNIIA